MSSLSSSASSLLLESSFSEFLRVKWSTKFYKGHERSLEQKVELKPLTSLLSALWVVTWTCGSNFPFPGVQGTTGQNWFYSDCPWIPPFSSRFFNMTFSNHNFLWSKCLSFIHGSPDERVWSILVHSYWFIIPNKWTETNFWSGLESRALIF